MLFNASTTRPAGAMIRTLRGFGAQFGAHMLDEYTQLYAVVRSDNALAALRLLYEAAMRPAFLPNEFQRERRTILSEMRRQDDDPSASFEYAINRAVFGSARLSLGRAGTRQSVMRLRPIDAREFHRRQYAPDNIIVSLDTSLPLPVVCDAVKATFGRLRGTKTLCPADARLVARASATAWSSLGRIDTSRTRVGIAWPTCAAQSADEVPLSVVASLLEDNARQAALQLGSIGEIGVYSYCIQTGGVFVIQLDPPFDRQLLATLRADLTGLIRSGVTPSRLIAAKHAIQFERDLRALEPLESAMLQALDRAAKHEHERIGAVRAIDCQDVARRYLQPRCAAIVYRSCATPHLPKPCEPETKPPRLPRSNSQHPHAYLFSMPSSSPLSRLAITWPGGVANEHQQTSGITSAATFLLQMAAKALLKDCPVRVETVLTAEAFGLSLAFPEHAVCDVVDAISKLRMRALRSDPTLPRTLALARLIASTSDVVARGRLRLVQAAIPDHPYGTSVFGTRRALLALHSTSIREWLSAATDRNPVVVLHCNPRTKARVQSSAKWLRAGAQYSATGEAIATPKWCKTSLVETATQRQTVVLVGMPLRLDTADTSMCEIAATAVSNSIFNEVRLRRRLAYTVGTELYTWARCAYLVAFAATTAKAAGRVCQALLDATRSTLANPHQREIDTAQRMVWMRREVGKYTSALLMRQAVSATAFGQRGFAAQRQFPQRVSADDVGQSAHLQHLATLLVLGTAQ